MKRKITNETKPCSKCTPKVLSHTRYSGYQPMETESQHETTYCFLHQESLVWEGTGLLFERKSVPTKKVHLHSGMRSLSHLRPTNISQISKPDLWDTF